MRKWSGVITKKVLLLLKLACALPNLANICLQSSISGRFYPFLGSDKDLVSKVRDNIVGGPSKVLTRKVGADEFHIRKSTKVCKLLAEMGASQHHNYAMCQPMPTSFYTRYEFDADLQRLKSH